MWPLPDDVRPVPNFRTPAKIVPLLPIKYDPFAYAQKFPRPSSTQKGSVWDQLRKGPAKSSDGNHDCHNDADGAADVASDELKLQKSALKNPTQDDISPSQRSVDSHESLAAELGRLLDEEHGGEDDSVAVASVVAPAMNENDRVTMTDNGNGNASHQPKVSLQPETFENERKDGQKEVSASAPHSMQHTCAQPGGNQKQSDQSANGNQPIDEFDMSSVNQDEENRGHALHPSRGQSQDGATYVDTQVDTALDDQGAERSEKETETETVAEIQTTSPKEATTTTVAAPVPAGPAGSDAALGGTGAGTGTSPISSAFPSMSTSVQPVQRKLHDLPAVTIQVRQCEVKAVDTGKETKEKKKRSWQTSVVDSILIPKQGESHSVDQVESCALPLPEEVKAHQDEYPFLKSINRPDKYTVENVLDGFAFHDDCLEIMDTDVGFFGEDAINTLMDKVTQRQTDTMSTSFSGIESPHTAACANRQALARRLGVEVPFPKLMHMVEWDGACQAELKLIAKETGACLFSDISSFFRPEVLETIDFLKQNPAMSVEILAPLLATGRLMKTSAHCLSHNRLCCLKTASSHKAGTMCTPYSKRGVQLGLKDECTLHSIAWVGLRLLLQEPDITQESLVH